MSEALRECPFCGGKADYISDDFGAWYIQCDDCTMWARPLGQSSKAESRKAWNTRAGTRTPAPQGAALELRVIADDVEICIDRSTPRSTREAVLASAVKRIRALLQEGTGG